jgi:opacity protein-like surface antigen
MRGGTSSYLRFCRRFGDRRPPGQRWRSRAGQHLRAGAAHLAGILHRRQSRRRLRSQRSQHHGSEEQDLTLNFSNDTEFIGGVHGGYNWQSDSLLIGIEGDIDFADNINFLASVRGRFGWATTNWLVYGTAGVAFIDTDNDFVVVSADDGPFGFSHGDNDTGFVVGGGIDYKVAPRVSIGVEGLFYDFGDDKKTFVAGEDEPFVLKDDLDFAVVRARLTYLFNGGSF